MSTELMTKEEALRGLAEILAVEADVNPELVTPEAKFVEDLEIDSLSLIGIVVAVEDRFNVQIPDDEVENIVTVDDFLKYVVRD